MKRATILFVLLAAVFSFGRNVSDEDIAHALKVALDKSDHRPVPDSLQVSSVLITNAGICIEYRSQNQSGALHTGFAVYKPDHNALFLDNSWIWEKACLTGRYAQRREGKNATQGVSAALQREAAAPVAPTSAAQPVVPVTATVVAPVPPVPPPVAIAARRPMIVQPVAPPVTTAAPLTVPIPTVIVPPVAPSVSTAAQATVSVATAPAPVKGVPSVPVTAPPVEQPVTTAPVPVQASAPPFVVVAAAPVAALPMTRAMLAPAAPVAPPQVAAPAPPAPRPVVRAAGPVSAVPAETATIHGVTIIDNNGALGEPPPGTAAPVAQESLADAARRVRREKQQ